jgi:hypothetical protein
MGCYRLTITLTCRKGVTVFATTHRKHNGKQQAESPPLLAVNVQRLVLSHFSHMYIAEFWKSTMIGVPMPIARIC